MRIIVFYFILTLDRPVVLFAVVSSLDDIETAKRSCIQQALCGRRTAHHHGNKLIRFLLCQFCLRRRGFFIPLSFGQNRIQRYVC